jgi:Cu/Ag efflux protein CusF
MFTSTITRTSLVLLSGLLTLSALPALAQVQHDRGAILNIDLRAMQVQIKDPKDRERIWPIAKDATVKFSDKAWTNRGSSLKDLRQGMYVHFTYSSGEPEVIQDFDVKDVGKGAAAAPAPAPTPNPAEGLTGKVTAVDPRTAQIEVILDRGGRKTFQAASASVLNGVRPGQRITLVTEPRNGQDVVVQVKR